MVGLNPVEYRTLQYWHGASARPQDVFYPTEMVQYEVLKIESQQCKPFGRYSDLNSMLYKIHKNQNHIECSIYNSVNRKCI